jgi:hypothetical protein
VENNCRPEENSIITLTEPEDSDFGGEVVRDYLYTLANTDLIQFTSSTENLANSYNTPLHPDFYSIIHFQGTNLDAPDGGTITEMSFSYYLDEAGADVSVATGFSMNSADLISATDAAKLGDTSELKALFEGLDWSLKTPGDVTNVVFGGTGGDDNVALSKRPR